MCFAVLHFKPFGGAVKFLAVRPETPAAGAPPVILSDNRI